MLILARPVLGQERALHWERWDVDVVIDDEGVARFREEQVIVIDSGSYRFGSRGFDLREGEAVSGVRISGNGQAYRQGSDEPGTFSVTQDDGRFAVQFWFADPQATRHEMTIEYTVEGGLSAFGQEQAELGWEFYGGHGFPIEQGRVSIQLPDETSAQAVSIGNTGIGTGGRLSNGDTVIFEVQNVGSGSAAMATTVRFPAELLAAGVTLPASDSILQAPAPRPGGNPSDPIIRPTPAGSEGGGSFDMVLCFIILFVFFIVMTMSRTRGSMGTPYDGGWTQRRGRWGGGGIFLPPFGGRRGGRDSFDDDGGGGRSSGGWGGGGSGSGGRSSGGWGSSRGGGRSSGSWGASRGGGRSSGGWGGSSSRGSSSRRSGGRRSGGGGGSSGFG